MDGITIAGGGLAGLSLATCLRSRGVPVIVLEAGDYPRHRVCGEFISGTSTATLNALGISSLLEDARKHYSLSWYHRGKCFYRTQLREPALGISRHLLDDRLQEHLDKSGGIVRTGTRADPEPAEGFVWAAGKKANGSDWIGLKIHARNLAAHADLEMHLGSNGYVGLAGVEDGWTNVCGLFRVDRSIRGKGPDLLANYLEAGNNSTLARELTNAEFREGSFRAVAGFDLGRQQNSSAVLNLGDAESLIPPFVGNGMSMAFQSAEIASAPLTAWAKGELSWDEAIRLIRDASRKKFRRRLMAAKIIHPILFSPSGRTLLRATASSGMLPFHTLLSFVR